MYLGRLIDGKSQELDNSASWPRYQVWWSPQEHKGGSDSGRDWLEGVWADTAATGMIPSTNARENSEAENSWRAVRRKKGRVAGVSE